MTTFHDPPTTLPEMLEVFDDWVKLYSAVMGAGFTARLDQLAARTNEDLSAFEVDISDPETARTVLAVILTLCNRARSDSGVIEPATLRQHFALYAAHIAALNGLAHTTIERQSR